MNLAKPITNFNGDEATTVLSNDLFTMEDSIFHLKIKKDLLIQLTLQFMREFIEYYFFGSRFASV